MSTFAYAASVEAEVQADDVEAQRYRAIKPRFARSSTPSKSVLFLRVSAAADYFTLDQSAMSRVPPVLVDIILDEYVWNVFPRSLLPTALYILFVAIAASLTASYIWQTWFKVSGVEKTIAPRTASSSKKAQ